MGKLADVLSHPEELLPLLRIAYASKQATRLPSDPKLAFCYDILNSVSRSFAVVIQQLPNPLRDAICVFYLVLRGLDTVEDDMAIPQDIKVPQLLSFHKSIYKRGFALECGYGHYVRLMQQFGTVVDVFLELDPAFQEVIANITKRMGAGMAKFITREVESVAEYDEYCHYVAGLVGVGLSDLFASSELENASLAREEGLSNHMGLFLQKTNIIRDYLEDIMEEPAPRMFWPREIWGRYAKNLEDFRDPSNRTAALHCLNHMIVDALQHVPYCMQYMSALRHPDVFKFCAIPQVMAIGTLAMCYNNGKVFQGVVKMRRGQTARVFDEVHAMPQLYAWFLKYLLILQTTATTDVASHDPTLAEARSVVSEHISLCQKGLDESEAAVAGTISISSSERAADFGLLLLAGAWFHAAWVWGGAATDASAGGVLRMLTAGGSGRSVLPSGYEGIEQALALLLLLAALSRVVLVRK